MRKDDLLHSILRPALFGGVGIVLALVGNTYATPSWMAVGTYTINKYSGNGAAPPGSSAPDLTYCNADGDNFYASALAHSHRGTPRQVNLKDNAVTKAAITNLSQREQCDFVFFSGHGTDGGTSGQAASFLGFGPAYGLLGPSDTQMGSTYNRWFCSHACLLFHVANPAGYWNNYFHGLRAMLAFRSKSFDHSVSASEWEAFWKGWVDSNRALWVAYRDAEADWQYRKIGTGGVEPGCLSAAGADYCNETYLQATSAKAANGAGVFYSTVFGAPAY